MSQSPDSVSGSDTSERHSIDVQTQVLPEVPVTTTEAGRGRSKRPGASRTTSSRNSQEDKDDYAPDDARAMSPRRPSEETEVLEESARCAVREQARQLQLSLLEIAESIELVKADHDKLEKQNLALQDYIGGLTRSMSKGQGSKGSKSSSK